MGVGAITLKLTKGVLLYAYFLYITMVEGFTTTMLKLLAFVLYKIIYKKSIKRVDFFTFLVYKDSI